MEFKCYYDESFIGTVMIYGKANWDKKYVEKRIYYNERRNEYFTRFDGEVVSLYRYYHACNPKPYYTILSHIRHFTKGCIERWREEN